jgi:site-specific DNA recombinase
VIQAGLYLGMSRDAEARGLGIGRQRKDGEALAGRLGWPVVQEYSDNDLSASTPTSPARATPRCSRTCKKAR